MTKRTDFNYFEREISFWTKAKYFTYGAVFGLFFFCWLVLYGIQIIASFFTGY